MKILKSIAIAALSSAAIFSFVACDNGVGNSGNSGASSKDIEFILDFNDSTINAVSSWGNKSYKNGSTALATNGLKCTPKDIPEGKKVKTWKIGPTEKEAAMISNYKFMEDYITFTDSELATLKKNEEGKYILPISYELRDSYTVTLKFDQDNAWCSTFLKKEIKPGLISEDELSYSETKFKFEINYNAYEKQWISEEGTKPYVYGYSIDGGNTIKELKDSSYISYGAQRFSEEFELEKFAGKTIDFKFITRPAKAFEIKFPESLSIKRKCYSTFDEDSHLADENLKGYTTNSDTNITGKKEDITSGTKIYEGESILIQTSDSSEFIPAKCKINGVALEKHWRDIILYSPDGTNYELWRPSSSLGIPVTDGIVIEYEK